MSVNKVLIITGPSGVGKSVLASFLQKQLNLARCITCTNRLPRSGEKHGIDYFFLSDDEFESEVSKCRMVEYDYHYGNGYGIRQADIDMLLKQGHVLLLLNWAGALSVEKQYQGACVFIAPASMDQLKERLIKRSGHADRLTFAHEDMLHQKDFKDVIVNDDLDVAKKELLAWAQRKLAE